MPTKLELEKQNNDLLEQIKEKSNTITKQSNQINELDDKINILLKQFEKIKKEKTISNEESHKSEEKIFKKIDPQRLVTVMNMVQCPCHYFSGEAQINFREFGDIDEITFENLKKLKVKYNRYFEEIEIKILDRDIIDAQGIKLRKYYDKYDISKEDFDNMCKMNPTAITGKLQTLSKPIQLSFVSYFVFEAVRGNVACMDMNKWEVLNEYFGLTDGKKIAELIEINRGIIT